MLSRIVFYLVAAPVMVAACLLAPVMYIGIILLWPFAFIYRCCRHEAGDGSSPLFHSHQHG